MEHQNCPIWCYNLTLAGRVQGFALCQRAFYSCYSVKPAHVTLSFGTHGQCLTPLHVLRGVVCHHWCNTLLDSLTIHLCDGQPEDHVVAHMRLNMVLTHRPPWLHIGAHIRLNTKLTPHRQGHSPPSLHHMSLWSTTIPPCTLLHDHKHLYH